MESTPPTPIAPQSFPNNLATRRESLDWDELENLLTFEPQQTANLASCQDPSNSASWNQQELDDEIDAIFDEILHEQKNIRQRVIEAQEKLKNTKELVQMDIQRHRLQTSQEVLTASTVAVPNHHQMEEKDQTGAEDRMKLEKGLNLIQGSLEHRIGEGESKDLQGKNSEIRDTINGPTKKHPTSKKSNKKKTTSNIVKQPAGRDDASSSSFTTTDIDSQKLTPRNTNSSNFLQRNWFIVTSLIILVCACLVVLLLPLLESTGIMDTPVAIPQVIEIYQTSDLLGKFSKEDPANMHGDASLILLDPVESEIRPPGPDEDLGTISEANPRFEESTVEDESLLEINDPEYNQKQSLGEEGEVVETAFSALDEQTGNVAVEQTSEGKPLIPLDPSPISAPSTSEEPQEAAYEEEISRLSEEVDDQIEEEPLCEGDNLEHGDEPGETDGSNEGDSEGRIEGVEDGEVDGMEEGDTVGEKEEDTVTNEVIEDSTKGPPTLAINLINDDLQEQEAYLSSEVEMSQSVSPDSNEDLILSETSNLQQKQQPLAVDDKIIPDSNSVGTMSSPYDIWVMASGLLLIIILVPILASYCFSRKPSSSSTSKFVEAEAESPPFPALVEEEKESLEETPRENTEEQGSVSEIENEFMGPTPDGSRGGYRMRSGEGKNYEESYRMKSRHQQRSIPHVPLPLLSPSTQHSDLLTSSKPRHEGKIVPLSPMTVQEALAFSISAKNLSLQE